ncbi:MAG: hypothetical protein KF772_03195 [Cryobacterium sp.]|nr:hypothetical protein [Cryobacterium sp.]
MNAKAETPAEDAAEAATNAANEAAGTAETAVADAADSATAAASAATTDMSALADEMAAADAALGEGEGDTGAQTPAQESAPVQTVYVHAPQPPKQKGNRGFGILFAFIATIVMAAAFAGIAFLATSVIGLGEYGSSSFAFLLDPNFYVPVLAFLVFMILWALLVNRAGWWSWVLGSFVVAVLTYGASIGILMLLHGGFGMTQSVAAATFSLLLVNPALIVAALLGRESALWFGGAVAKRGRKVRQRNYEAWQAFEQEQAAKRA